MYEYLNIFSLVILLVPGILYFTKYIDIRIWNDP